MNPPHLAILPIAPAPRARYVRAARVLHFPESAEVPETKPHLELRILLYEIALHCLADLAGIGSDQFVYFDASNPDRCLSPDLFLCLGERDVSFGSWKTWERSTPQLAVEIVSGSDARKTKWAEKLDRYRDLGIAELVRFHATARVGARLRVWDRVGDDLIERVVEGDTATCDVLGLWWVVAPGRGKKVALRLSRDPEGRDLLLTEAEAAEQAREAECRAREEAEQARQEAERSCYDESKAREAAERAREAESKAREAAENALEAAERAREADCKAREAAERARDDESKANEAERSAREQAERARDDEIKAREQAERAREQAERARDDEIKAREAAEKRIAELEERLRRAGGTFC